MKTIVCLLLVLSSFNLLAQKEDKTAFDQRMAWFNESKFGMFIHWGAYSNLKGSWKKCFNLFTFSKGPSPEGENIISPR